MKAFRFLSFLNSFFFLLPHFAFTAIPDPEQSATPPGMIFELLALNHDLPTAAKPKYLSPCDMAASLDGKYLYVAEQTAKQVAVVDLSLQMLIAAIKVPNEVTGVAVSKNGLVYATCSSDLWPNGMVCEISPSLTRVLRRFPAGHGARSPVISPVENTLFVCNVYDGDVSAIDIGSGKEIKRIEAVREPYCAAITPDGATLVVGNALPTQRSTDTTNVACKITLINAMAREKTIDIRLPVGSKSVFGVAVSPDGKYAFATHEIGMFALPATRIDNGWIHTNSCAIVDIKNQKILNDATLDAPLQGSANPWGITCSPDGKMVCVAHAGSNELTIIDLKQFITIAETTAYSVTLVAPIGTTTVLAHNLAALLDISDKVPVIGKTPKAITIVGNKAITVGYFGESLEVFNLSLPGSGTKTSADGSITLGTTAELTGLRKGEIAFCDGKLCYQKWATCQTCHPFCRCDALNWTLRGALVAPRNSKSFVYSWWTPPTNWSGARKDASESDKYGLANELFLEPDNDAAAYLDTFLMKLKPVPSPRLVKGNLSEAAKRGKEIYFGNKASCAVCHPGPLYADKKFHDAKIPDKYDDNKDWDTPSLIECWRTAPYGHLGSVLTIKEMIGLPGMSNAAANLSQDEINDLAEFVLSL